MTRYRKKKPAEPKPVIRAEPSSEIALAVPNPPTPFPNSLAALAGKGENPTNGTWPTPGAALTPGAARTPPKANTAQLTPGVTQTPSEALTPGEGLTPVPVRIRMEGEFWFWHSLAGVNRELAIRLAMRQGIEISFAPTGPRQFGPEVDRRLAIIDERTFAGLSGPADFHFRHFYPPRLNAPIEGLLVVMLAWEYGYLPIRWIPEMLANVAAFFCYSEAIKQTYIASGIPEERLFTIPLGVDTKVFRPNGLKHVFTTEPGAHRLAAFDEPPFVFLFCGGAMDRKGVDILEKAMLHAFAPGDSVVCVVKDFCSRTVYRGATAGDRFRALAADVTRPLFIYIDDDMTPAQLAALYRAADVIVIPYRAEGFSLPTLEGMSSGKPVIVTTGLPHARAATDDYADETVGWLVRAERRPYGNRMIGEWACCGETWWLEPDVKALAKAMREAYNNRDEVRNRGEAAAKRAREQYTWEHTVDKMVERLEALAEKGRRGDASTQETPSPTSPQPSPDPSFLPPASSANAALLPASSLTARRPQRTWREPRRGGDARSVTATGEAQTPPEANAAKQTPGEALTPPEANAAQLTPDEAQTPPEANAAKPTPGEALTPPEANAAKPTPGEALTPPEANAAKPTPGEALTPPEANTAKQTLTLVTATDIIDRRSGAPATVIRPPSFRRSRPFITLCMIVRQEAKNIGACLKSVREADCVDEICVTDTGSTDDTTLILKEYGVKISYFTWIDSFSAARNYSFDQAPKETKWRLWIDADDTFPMECGAKLRESVLLAEARTMGILVPVHIPPRPGEYGYTIVDHCKLIRAGHEAEFRWESRIHEQIMDSITRRGWNIERSEAYVVHSGYDYSPEGQKRKRERDAKLLALDEADNSSHPMHKWNSGMTAFHLKDFPRAIEKLEQCLALSKPQESTVHKCYAMIGGAYFEMGNFDKAREYLDLGLTMFPNDTEILFRTAGLYRDLGDLPAAERLYLRLLTPRDNSGIDSLDVTMGTYKGQFNLGSVYLAMQRYAEAERCYRIALQQCPPFVPGWQMLGTTYVRMRRFDDAREVQRKLAELSPDAANALGREIAGIGPLS